MGGGGGNARGGGPATAKLAQALPPRTPTLPFPFQGEDKKENSHPYFTGPLPVQFGGLLALMRRASLTSSLMAPVIGSDRPALSVMSATICMSLSAQVKEIMSHSLSASDAPELIISASRNLTRSMPVDSASRPASIRPTALIPRSRVFM